MSAESAAKGKQYSAATILDKAVSRGKSTKEKADALLAKIHPTDKAADLAGCDLVIEAVFESVDLKHKVFAEIEGVVAQDAVLGSNTSTLPITALAEGVKRKQDFIGLHFFSPVDKMPLLEIIAGKDTSPATLAKAFDLAAAIDKTPILVNDSRGFFTSRVIGTFLNEAIAMVGEGIHPSSIEQAGAQAGYPAPPLQLMDELTLTLGKKIRGETKTAMEASGKTFPVARQLRRRRRARRQIRPQGPLHGRWFLRLRGRQAHASVAGPEGALHEGRPGDSLRGHEGAHALRRIPRDRALLRRGGLALDSGREHRLDHGHWIPALDRRGHPVHQQLRGWARAAS